MQIKATKMLSILLAVMMLVSVIATGTAAIAATDDTVATGSSPEGFKTFYFESPAAWGSAKVYLNGGSVSWPGEKMTHIGGRVYAFTCESGFNTLTFSNGDIEFPNGSNQTRDVNTIEDGKIFKTSSLIGDGADYGKWDGVWGTYSQSSESVPLVYITSSATFLNSIDVQLAAAGAQQSSYSINGGAPVSFTGSATLSSLGSSDAVGGIYVVKVTASNAYGVTSKTSVFKKIAAPTETLLYLNNVKNWTVCNAYIWNVSVGGTGWPGIDITGNPKSKEGYIIVSVTDTSFNRIIFNNKTNGGNEQSADLEFTFGKSMVYHNDTGSWMEYGVDSAGLEMSLAIAKGINSSDVTAASFDVIGASIENGEDVLENGESQEEYDSARREIDNAVVNAVYIDVLSAYITSAKQWKQSDLTSVSWNSLQSELAAAKQTVSDGEATQAEVNAAAEGLREIINSLEFIAPKAITVYFKSSSSYGYMMSVSVDGAKSIDMTWDRVIQNNATNTAQYGWYKTIINTRSNTPVSLSFSTKRYFKNASVTISNSGNDAPDTYYFGVANLNTSNQIINLTDDTERDMINSVIDACPSQSGFASLAGAKGVKATGAVAPESTGATVRIYFDNTTAQWPSVRMNLWQGPKTGFQDLTRIGTTDIWYIDLDTAVLSGNFLTGNWVKQTNNLDSSEYGGKSIQQWVADGKPCFKMTGDGGSNRSGQWVAMSTSSTVTVTNDDSKGSVDKLGVNSGVSSTEQFVITATPIEGYEVATWTLSPGGTISSTGVNQLSYAYAQDTTVTPNYTQILYANVTVQNDASKGTVAISPSGSLGLNTWRQSVAYTITATPIAGYEVLSWSVGGASVQSTSANTLAMKFTSDATVYPVYTEKPTDIRIYFRRTQSWITDSNAVMFAALNSTTYIRMTPLPIGATGSAITHWYADVPADWGMTGKLIRFCRQNPTDTAAAKNPYDNRWNYWDAAARQSAQYQYKAPDSSAWENQDVYYTLDLRFDTAKGSVSGLAAGANTVNKNNDVTLTATPAQGYRFSKWLVNGADGATTSVYTSKYTANSKVEAVFVQDNASVTFVNDTSKGSLAFTGSDSSGGTIFDGDVKIWSGSVTYTITASPVTGYQVSTWQVSGFGTVNSTSANALSRQFTADCTVTPIYTLRQCSYTATAGTGGSVSQTSGTGQYNTTVITLTATPDAVSVFDQWAVFGSGNVQLLPGYSLTDATIEFKLTGDASFTAYFADNTFNVKLGIFSDYAAHGGSGMLKINGANPPAGGVAVVARTDVTLSAIPDEGNSFYAWYINIGTADEPVYEEVGVTENSAESASEVTLRFGVACDTEVFADFVGGPYYHSVTYKYLDENDVQRSIVRQVKSLSAAAPSDEELLAAENLPKIFNVAYSYSWATEDGAVIFRSNEITVTAARSEMHYTVTVVCGSEILTLDKLYGETAVIKASDFGISDEEFSQWLIVDGEGTPTGLLSDSPGFAFKVLKSVIISLETESNPAYSNSVTRIDIDQPVYELYFDGGVEKVRMNMLVSGHFEDDLGYSSKDVTSTGILRYLSDGYGNPTGHTAYTQAQLIEAAKGNTAGTTITRSVSPVAMNAQGLYMYAATMSNTEANRNKNYTFYAYMLIGDQVFVSEIPAISDIKKV